MIKFLVKVIIRNPIKVVMITLLFIVAALVGVLSINLATGNDTLVKPDTDVYQDNLYYENTFGSDPILILLEKQDGVHDINLYLTLHQIEQQLSHHEAVYTINSNASLIVHMLAMQEEQFKSGIYEMGMNLLNMSQTIVTNKSQLEGLDAAMLQSLESELITAFSQMSEGQNQLEAGLNDASISLEALSALLDQQILALEEKENPDLQQEITVLKEIYQNLNGLSAGLINMTSVPSQTQFGLSEISHYLSIFFSELYDTTDSMAQMSDDLTLLSNGLAQMGNALLTMHHFSDSYVADFPKEPETINRLLYENDQLRAIFEPIIIDDSYQMMSIVLKGDLSDETKEQLVEDIEQIILVNYGGNYLISGKPVLDLSIKQSMMDSMQSMLMLSVAIMVIVLFLTFKVRWRLLPLLTILLAVIASVGIMGWLNIPVTMVSMAVFPILIGLGIDYAIQFQSRYEEYYEEEIV